MINSIKELELRRSETLAVGDLQQKHNEVILG